MINREKPTLSLLPPLAAMGLCLLALWPVLPAQADDYFPARGQWQRKAPAEAGFDASALADAIAYARSRAELEPADMHAELMQNYTGKEPQYQVLGPTRDRTTDSGLIVHDGYIIAEWGDPQRADMTFSVVKSYLSSLAALALADGLIDDLHKPVRQWVQDGHYAADHNRPITWHHLLQQTSDWQGSLWGVPDWADRPVGETPEQWSQRPLNPPGSHFKYNDVRVNLLAYSLLQVWRQPLPQVLRERIMDPIGASTSWRWHGYHNSWVELDGLKIQSVAGGGHFGGGLFINTLDHARYGLLFLRQGRWQQRQLIPREWLSKMRQPTTVKPDYGYLWWLNTDRQRLPSAPATAYWAAGYGGHYIYIDETHQLVIVLRWIPALEEVVAKVLAAYRGDS